jgi:hypothetical protein
MRITLHDHLVMPCGDFVAAVALLVEPSQSHLSHMLAVVFAQMGNLFIRRLPSAVVPVALEHQKYRRSDMQRLQHETIRAADSARLSFEVYTACTSQISLLVLV